MMAVTVTVELGTTPGWRVQGGEQWETMKVLS
jgi:hypothetical protein